MKLLSDREITRSDKNPRPSGRVLSYQRAGGVAVLLRRNLPAQQKISHPLCLGGAKRVVNPTYSRT